jgi:beta-lactamase class A
MSGALSGRRWRAVAGLAVLCAAIAVPPAAGLPDAPPPPPVRPAAPPAPSEEEILAGRLNALAQGFDGEVGIAVRQVGEGWAVSVNGERPMPQQSVSKLWVSLALLAALDRGELSLDERVTIHKADLSLFHQPIRDYVGDAGYSASLEILMEGALRRSDNAANDALIRRLGGPFAVRVAIVGRNLEGVRFGPGERAMQTAAAGLDWRPEFSFGRAFWEAREALPHERRAAALAAYLADPPDAATPLGITLALARLQRGELLSPASTALLLKQMEASGTGAGRLRAGLPPGWRLAHKTGTGQVMGALATGYNDVGLIVAPDGRVYAVAVMIASTRRPLPERQALMAAVARAVAGAPEPVVAGPPGLDAEPGPDG